MATTKQFIVQCSDEFREIIMAEFAIIGFDSFQETEDGFIGHGQEDINDQTVKEIILRYSESSKVSVSIETVKQENWNKKWEESYDPLIIADRIFVRASFHKPNPELPIEIIINPKMSFGTGHHETTHLMMELQLGVDHKNKKVLDAGSGTGILTILAGKLGAKELYAYDNDPWVKDNIQENLEINDIASKIMIGTIETLELPTNFDIILANINKNILLHDIAQYTDRLMQGGHLLLSGFYEEDLDDIELKCNDSGLRLAKSISRNRWMAAQFLK